MINSLFTSRTFKNIESCRDLPRRQRVGFVFEHRESTYPFYKLQKISNAALGALACYYLYPTTLLVASLSVGSVFATLGFGLGVYAIAQVFSNTAPLVGYKNTKLDTEICSL